MFTVELNKVGCEIAIAVVPVQPLASVAVIVYVPLA
jgi:hypothetical protein